MGLFPIFMNIIQFWVIDSIIKVGGVGGLSTPPEEEPDDDDSEADQEPLIDDCERSDEEAEEEDGAAMRDVEAQTTTATTRLRHSADSTHTYPPPTSPTTIRYSSVSPPPALSRSLPLIQRRRSPPAPLRLHGLSSRSLPSRASESGVRMKEDWQTWDREEDYVSEEDDQPEGL